MPSAPNAALAVRKLDAPLGAEILGADLSQPLDVRAIATILEAWH